MKRVLMITAATMALMTTANAQVEGGVNADAQSQVGVEAGAGAVGGADANAGAGMNAEAGADAVVAPEAGADAAVEMAEGAESTLPPEVNAEMLLGADVISAEGEDVGEISDIVFTSAGDIEAAVVDVGGFLGLGVHTVALELDQLEVTVEGETEVLVEVSMTKEELEALPEYVPEEVTPPRATPATPAEPANPGAPGDGAEPATPAVPAEPAQ